MVKSFVNFLLLSALTVLACGDEYESNIKFTLYNNGKSFESNFTTPPSSQGCNKAGSFSFITHGWQGSNSGWILDMISNFTAYRGGCVIFMNYSYYSDRINYFEVIGFFKPIASLVTRKLQQLNSDGVVDDNIFMFGFSFGGRIVIEAALNYGTKRISQIDSCDMAGPGFDFVYNRDPKDAAKNVQCIHTSISAGTIIRNCHQDWLMGHCGKFQDGAQDLQAAYCDVMRNCATNPILSHSLCPIFYNSAFKNNFIADVNINCFSPRMAKSLPASFKMGYMEKRKNSLIIGDIPVATSKFYPYTTT